MKKTIAFAALFLALASSHGKADEAVNSSFKSIVMTWAHLEALLSACGQSDPALQMEVLTELSRIPNFNVYTTKRQMDDWLEGEKFRTGSDCTAESPEYIASSRKTFDLQMGNLRDAITTAY